jgi:hypothetical protein
MGFSLPLVRTTSATISLPATPIAGLKYSFTSGRRRIAAPS